MKTFKSTLLDMAAHISKIRDRRQELLDKRESLAGALLPLEDGLANIGRFVARLAEGAEQKLSIWQFAQPGATTAGTEKLSDLELAAITDPAALEESLASRLKMVYAGRKDEPLTLAKRQKQADALTAEIEQLEIEEESVIRSSEEAGLQMIRRRADADPMTVLGLRPSDLPLPADFSSEIFDRLIDLKESSFEVLRQATSKNREMVLEVRRLEGEVYAAERDFGQAPANLHRELEVAKKKAERAAASYQRAMAENEPVTILAGRIAEYVKANSRPGGPVCMTPAEWEAYRSRNEQRAGRRPAESPFM